MISTESHFARRLLGWYDRSRRDLPWRVALGSRPDPYHTLVSETMLQQTQVATVIPYYHRFLNEFPTVRTLADADEQRVLKLWQGLGYYSRARNLRAAARQIVEKHGGQVPSDVQSLLALPGVGRYTAGAVASIAFDTKAPIVDGNVARVICRLDRIETDLKDHQTQKLLWERATQILPDRRAGDFNSALMELGSTVCTPRSPQCLLCPVQKHCEAHAAGVQDRIPMSRRAKPIPLVHRRTFCLRRGTNGKVKWLIEQRPPRGRWASLWQFVTVEVPAPRGSSGSLTVSGASTPRVTSRMVRTAAGVKSGSPRHLGIVEHSLTHRRYRFEVFVCESCDDSARQPENRRWVQLKDLEHYPLPRPHVRILEMLREMDALSQM
jgi:A/G-specific adenine glycosylase